MTAVFEEANHSFNLKLNSSKLKLLFYCYKIDFIKLILELIMKLYYKILLIKLLYDKIHLVIYLLNIYTTYLNIC